MTAHAPSPKPVFNTPALQRRRRRRVWLDRFGGRLIAACAALVLAAVLLMGFYLISQVWPLGQSAHFSQVATGPDQPWTTSLTENTLLRQRLTSKPDSAVLMLDGHWWQLDQVPVAELPAPKDWPGQAQRLDELASSSLSAPVLALLNALPGPLLFTLSADDKLHAWQWRDPAGGLQWQDLWGKVQYPHYAEPAYVWQSTASQSSVPKFSLTPLAYGTFKAACYAMLLALPLALGAAIFCGYFMSPAQRRRIKPCIELMEAMPTVILGFFAGLVLAPQLEAHLFTVVMAALVIPVGILLLGLAMSALPHRLRPERQDGRILWLILPAVLLLIWACSAWAPVIEHWAFHGDFRAYLTDVLDIPYAQRNALIVGLAMGFAIIPTLFSISEEAIRGVPGRLASGSLALGASHWQTLTRVVLPTASAGIFAAIMLSIGRAVGETMIVLMASGNTPLMSSNPFEGMRTLAATIAMELPESGLESVHYRILFLAALVLFLFCILMNTGAELIRQRLRHRYGAL
ncbi:ABC transporter permease subunit [Pokkaliibacter sp. CJK22405]|uniref:ABC transporter permease subunit n=1 Tax=Pokkaliibacter sp. CJK22405 TaxID=3384615 RepID=UPI003984F85B